MISLSFSNRYTACATKTLVSFYCTPKLSMKFWLALFHNDGALKIYQGLKGVHLMKNRDSYARIVVSVLGSVLIAQWHGSVWYHAVPC